LFDLTFGTPFFKSNARLIYCVNSAKLRTVIFIVALLFFFHLFCTHPGAFAIHNDTITLNLSKGYVNGGLALFVATDSSDNQTAYSISESLGQKINFAPLLKSIPQMYLQQGYDFLNGMEGEGSFGFQLPVASALPGDKDYSPLVQLNFVKWNDGADARILKSSEEIEQAQRNGEIQIMKIGIIVNSPAIQHE
jgi:hypothetical protein